MKSVISLFARILLALIFLLSALSKIGNYGATVAAIAAQGIPAAPFFLYAAVLVEIGGALSVITGYRARLGALVLIAYLIPITYIFHLQGALNQTLGQIRQADELISVLKNMSIMGGLLLMYANGPGKLVLGKEG